MKNAMNRLAIAALSLALVVGGCMRHGASSQEIASDLQNYSIELQKWEPKEKDIFQAIDDVEESRYVDDEFVARTLKGVLPALDDHIREVAAYRPTTPELASLHEHYRKGWEELRAGIDTMIAAEGKKDYIQLAKGKSQMNNGRSTLMRAFASMDALMQDNDEAMKSMRKS